MVSRGGDGKALGFSQKKRCGIPAPKRITTHLNGHPKDKYVAVRKKDEVEIDSSFSCQLPPKNNKERKRSRDKRDPEKNVK